MTKATGVAITPLQKGVQYIKERRKIYEDLNAAVEYIGIDKAPHLMRELPKKKAKEKKEPVGPAPLSLQVPVEGEAKPETVKWPEHLPQFPVNRMTPEAAKFFDLLPELEDADPVVRADTEYQYEQLKESRDLQKSLIFDPKDVETPAEMKERLVLLEGIEKMRKEMGLEGPELEKILWDVARDTNLAAMTPDQLRDVEVDFIRRSTVDFAHKTAAAMGMTTQERDDLMKASGYSLRIMRRVFNSRIKSRLIEGGVEGMPIEDYTMELSEDKQIRRRQLERMHKLAHHQTQIAKRQYKMDMEGKKLTTVMNKMREFSKKILSAKDFFGHIDERWGTRTVPHVVRIQGATIKGMADADEAYDAAMVQHNLPRGTGSILERPQAIAVTEYLYAPDNNEAQREIKNELWENLDDKSKTVAAALDNLVNGTGEYATRLRSILFKRWYSVIKDMAPKRLALMNQRELWNEGSKQRKALDKKIANIDEMIKDALPKHADLDDMRAVEAALANGTYYEHLSQQTWGTRRAYFMSDMTFDTWADELLDLLEPPTLADKAMTTSTRVNLDDVSLHHRTKKGNPLFTSNPRLAIKQHGTRLATIDEMFWPMEDLHKEFTGIELSETFRKAIKAWSRNAAGKYEDPGELIRGLNFIKRQWWRQYGWSPTKQGKFWVRNFGQSFLGLAQLDTVQTARSLPRAMWSIVRNAPELLNSQVKDIPVPKGVRINPYLVQDMKRFGSIEIAQRAQLYQLMTMNELAKGGDVSEALGTLSDFAAQGMGISDSINRFVGTWPVAYQIAWDNVGYHKLGQINTKTLYQRLKLDIMSQADQEILERLLETGDTRTFARQYANMKTRTIHYEYSIAARSMLEQRSVNRSFLGVMTWPRNATLNYINHGAKPMIEGYRTGNMSKSWEGAKVILKYLMTFGALGAGYEELLDDKLYGILTSLRYSPGSPELSTATHVLKSLRRGADRLMTSPSLYSQKSPTEIALNLIADVSLEAGELALPMTALLMDSWVAMAENSGDYAELKRREAIGLAFDKGYKRKLGPNAERATRTVKQQVLNLFIGLRATKQSEREEDRKARREGLLGEFKKRAL
jgi:hypothetical protein